MVINSISMLVGASSSSSSSVPLSASALLLAGPRIWVRDDSTADRTAPSRAKSRYNTSLHSSVSNKKNVHVGETLQAIANKDCRQAEISKVPIEGFCIAIAKSAL
jgi:hypothetical protein